MRIDFHGLIFETPRVSVYLWTPWRASALEHRLFDAVRQAVDEEPEEQPDELRIDVDDTDTNAWERFDPVTFPKFSDDDLITAMFSTRA